MLNKEYLFVCVKGNYLLFNLRLGVHAAYGWKVVSTTHNTEMDEFWALLNRPVPVSIEVL